MLASRSLPPILDSLVTRYIRPAATPDSSTRIRRAAISVNPRELFFPYPMVWSPAPEELLLIAIAKCHIARADRRGQVHVLGLVAVVDNALSHDHDVDLLHVVGRFANTKGVRLVGIERASVVTVVGELQVDDVVGHRYRSESVDLAHQARGLT